MTLRLKNKHIRRRALLLKSKKNDFAIFLRLKLQKCLTCLEFICYISFSTVTLVIYSPSVGVNPWLVPPARTHYSLPVDAKSGFRYS